MSSALKRYYPRSPRYVLQPLDRTVLRFAQMQTRGISATTTITDVSESGLCFTLSSEAKPDEGDMLKVEFTVPGRGQIACFATVVRVEEKTGLTYVGILFRNLPSGHRRILGEGLTQVLARSKSLSVAEWGVDLAIENNRVRRHSPDMPGYTSTDFTPPFAAVGTMGALEFFRMGCMGVALACWFVVLALPPKAWFDFATRIATLFAQVLA